MGIEVEEAKCNRLIALRRMIAGNRVVSLRTVPAGSCSTAPWPVASRAAEVNVPSLNITRSATSPHLLKKSVQMLRSSQSWSPLWSVARCTQVPTETPKLGLTSKLADSGAFECAFFDFRAKAYAAAQSTAQMYCRLKLSKRRIYEWRVRDVDVEMSTFTLLAFSDSGWFGRSIRHLWPTRG